MSEVADPTRLRQLLDAVLTVGSDLDLPAMLRRLVQVATELVDARYGALGVLNDRGTGLAQFLTVGMDDQEQEAIGDVPAGHGILGLLIVDAKPLRLPNLAQHPDSHGFPPNHPPMTSFLGVPILIRDEVFGNLYLTDKQSGPGFTDVDEELAVGLASAAGVAIENARLHARLHELAVVEDRERIARDLHDTVIQRVFATGLALQATIPLVDSDPELAIARIEGAVDDLDLTVKHIRTAIFDLELNRAHGAGLRAQILDLVHEAADTLSCEPRVLLDGPLDSAISEATAVDLMATLREAITNVTRHAEASSLEIAVVVEGDNVSVTVIDDGVGPPSDDAPRGHGLRNMAARAEKLGGTFGLRAGEPRGCVLTWSVPWQ